MRAALLRLFERVGEDQFSWPSEEVRDEVLRDEPVLDKWRMLEGVQRVGRRVAKGVTSFSRGKWCELVDDIECTYERGTFTVRRRPPKFRRDRGPLNDVDPSPPPHILAKPDPALTKAFEDIRALDGEVKNRNVLEPDDATIQVTWIVGEHTALVTARRKDSDLTPVQLRSFAAALLEAAADLDGTPTDSEMLGLAVKRADGWMRRATAAEEKLRRHGIEPLSDDDLAAIRTVERILSPEPRVTQRHLDLMRHATGGRLRAVRNYSIAPPDSDAHPTWCELVAMGLAGEGEPPDCSEAGQRKGRVFHVTAAGFRMAYGDVRKGVTQ